MKNKILISGLIASAAIFLFLTPALAVELAPDQDSAPVVASEEGEPVEEIVEEEIIILDTATALSEHSGTYFYADESVVLSDHYLSDVIVAGQTITLSPEAIIEGDLITAAETVNVYGTINGDLRAAASTISLVGAQIDHSATLFAAAITTDQNTVIAGDATVYAGQTDLQGTVSGQTYLPEPEEETESAAKPFLTFGQVIWSIIKLFGLLLIGVILLYLFPAKFTATTKVMFDQPGRSLLKGLLWVIVAPLVLILLLFTIIGLPLSIVGFILYGLAIYLAPLAVGLALGQKMLPKAANLFWPLILGTVLFYIARLVPYAGGILGFAGALWAIGAFSLGCGGRCQDKKSKKSKK